jgi:hypothetical protein
MDSKDVERYMLAKRQQRFTACITVAALLICVAAAVLLYLGIAPSISKAVVIGSAAGLLLANSEFGLYGTVVSRQALLEIIENQINRDPDALAYLARKS